MTSRLTVLLLLIGNLIQSAPADMRLAVSSLQVKTRASGVQLAAQQEQLYCGKSNGQLVGCWDKKKYDEWAQQNGQVENYQQSNHGWDGQIAVPDYQGIDYVVQDQRIPLSEKYGVSDPETGDQLQFDLKSPAVQEWNRDVQTGVAAGAMAIEDLFERQERIEQQREALQKHYNQSVANKNAYVDALRKNGNKIEAESQKALQESIVNINMALARLNQNLLSKAQREALTKSRQIRESDLNFSEYSMDRAAHRALAKQIERAARSKDLKQLSQLLEAYHQARIDGKTVQIGATSYSNVDGVMNLSRLTGKAGPLDATRWKTALKSEQGQIVRRLANRYQRLFAQSDNLSVYSSSEKSRYALGLLALQAGDGSIDSLFERGSGFLRLAEIMADSLEGFSQGLGESLSGLIQSVPELASLAGQGVSTLFTDPAQAWSAVVEFSTRVPEIGGAILIAVNQDLKVLNSGSAYERGELVGKYAIDIVGLIGSGGSLNAVKGIAKAGSLEKVLQSSKALAASSKFVSHEVRRAVGNTLEKTILEVDAIPKVAREGIMDLAEVSPEAAAQFGASYKKAAVASNNSTTEYLQKVAASGAQRYQNADTIKAAADSHEFFLSALDDVTPTRFEGIVSRGIERKLITTENGSRMLTKDDVFALSPRNQYADHRFTIGGELGNRGQYMTIGDYDVNTIKKVISDEIDIPNQQDVIFDRKNLMTDGILDLNNEKVQSKLNLNHKLINDLDYTISQSLGDAAKQKGFNGIKFPSSKDGKVNNIIIFE